MGSSTVSAPGPELLPSKPDGSQGGEVGNPASMSAGCVCVVCYLCICVLCVCRRGGEGMHVHGCVHVACLCGCGCGGVLWPGMVIQPAQCTSLW